MSSPNRSYAQDYVPGPNDRVELRSPYGNLQVHSPSPPADYFISNGVQGLVVANATGGGLTVLFDCDTQPHDVPIHWLTVVKGEQE